MRNHSTINAQLIFGVIISEEFSEIIHELEYDFNGEDNIFIQVGEDTILGVGVPHEDIYNSQEHVLFRYPQDFSQKCTEDFYETLGEFEKEMKKAYTKEKLMKEDYDFLMSELQLIKQEIPQAYLFAVHS